MNIIKKLSPKTVCGKIKELVPSKEGDSVELYRLIGTATGYLTKDTDFGTSVCLKGQFKATRKDDGEEYMASKCYLSDEIADAIVGQLNAEGIDSVDFGFTVSLTATDSTIGYEYGYRSLIELHQADPLAALEAKISSEQAATKTKPAPKKKGKK